MQAKPAAQTLSVATSGDYAPFSTWVLESDRPTGFAPAVLETFARSADVSLAWSRFRWTDVAAGMREGRWDIVADGITVRPERSIAGAFTIPIARGGAVLLLRRPAWAARDAGIHELDRKELRVVVNRGGHLEHVAHALFHDAEVRAIPDNAAVRDALARGEADAAMTNTFEAPRWSAGLAGVETIGPLTNDVTALWVRAGREEIARQLDEWLLAAEKDGRLADLRARLLGPG
ncbi:MAG TPA: transporter substrate-binding domain-containing protein, partial [Labilithrix sp.]